MADTLNLELESLRDPLVPLVFASEEAVCWKSHRDAPQEAEKQKIARAIGSRLGRLAAGSSAPSPVGSGVRAAAAVRAEILQGAATVGLRELLAWSWDHGIPVISATLPNGFRKWDGMALAPHGEPVIVAFCNHTEPAWQAFIVAHELGHHLLGHVKPNTEIFDTKTGEDTDAEEAEANAFAVTLLTGDAIDEYSFEHPALWPRQELFADDVKVFALKHRIDPATVALNLMHRAPQRIALCMAVAKRLTREEASPTFAEFYRRLATDQWSEDERFFFESLTGIS